MSPEPPQLESVPRVAPFGVRFRDAATGELAIERLGVVAYPEGRPGLRVAAVETRSGVYAFTGLPGLRDWENGAGDDDFWKAPLPATRFTVEVNDPEGRYLPLRLTGLTALRWRQPLPDPVTLFWAPGRAVPTGMAAVRAQLFDPAAQAAAAWAVIDATLQGAVIATGLADERGCVLLPFPYPRPPPPAADAAVDTPPPFTAQQWSLTFAARYPLPGDAVPPADLATLLGQPAAKLWADTAQATPFGGAALRYGVELVLRSVGADGAPSPYLFVTPA